MEEDIDRVEFYHHLKYCKSLEEIKTLIDNIDDDELQIKMKDKYIQFLEYNKKDKVNLETLIMTLESTYLDFKNSNNIK